MWKLKPTDNNFFYMLHEIASLIPEAGTITHQFVLSELSVTDAMDKLNALQDESNRLTAEVIDKVGKSYVPPMDRQDIFRLARQLNDLLRVIHATVERIKLYHLDKPNKDIINLINLLLETLKRIPDITANLSDIRSKAEQIMQLCNYISDQENEADYYYRHALAELFDTCHGTAEIIKWRDICQHLEKAFDNCERLADTIKGAVMKYV